MKVSYFYHDSFPALSMHRPISRRIVPSWLCEYREKGFCVASNNTSGHHPLFAAHSHSGDPHLHTDANAPAHV